MTFKFLSATWGILVASGLVLAMSFIFVPASLVFIDEISKAGFAHILTALLGSILLFLLFQYSNIKITRDRSIVVIWQLTLAFFVLHLIPLLILDSTPVRSDFLTYWQEAISLTDGGNDFPVKSVYERRTLPFLYPLVMLFGSKYAVYQAFNLLLMTAMFFLVSNFSRVRFGSAVGIGTALFLLAVPELYGVVFYAHHDFYGAALLLACFFLVLGLESDRKAAISVVLSLLLSLVIALFWFQRGLHMPVFAALFVCLVVGTRRVQGDGKLRIQVRDWLLLLLLPLAVFQGSLWVSEHLEISEPAPQRIALSFAVYGNGESKGTYAFGAGSPVINALDESEQKAYGMEIITRDFLENPVKYLWSRYLKATRLFEFGSNDWFYAPPKKSKTVYRLYDFSAVAFRLIMNLAIVVLGLWACIKLVRDVVNNEVSFERAILFAGFMVAMISFSFSAFFETTSRHLIPAYFLLPLFFGRLLAAKDRAERPEKAATRSETRVLIPAAFLAAASVVVAFYGLRELASGQWILVDWRKVRLTSTNLVREINDIKFNSSVIPAEAREFIWSNVGVNAFGKYDYFILPKRGNEPSFVEIDFCGDKSVLGNSMRGFIETIPDLGATDVQRCAVLVPNASSVCNRNIQAMSISVVDESNCRQEIEFPVSEGVGGWRLALFSSQSSIEKADNL